MGETVAQITVSIESSTSSSRCLLALEAHDRGACRSGPHVISADVGARTGVHMPRISRADGLSALIAYLHVLCLRLHVYVSPEQPLFCEPVGGYLCPIRQHMSPHGIRC